MAHRAMTLAKRLLKQSHVGPRKAANRCLIRGLLPENIVPDIQLVGEHCAQDSVV